jgi:hypothetical protein
VDAQRAQRAASPPGEIEGIDLTFEFLRDKRNQAERAARIVYSDTASANRPPLSSC